MKSWIILAAVSCILLVAPANAQDEVPAGVLTSIANCRVYLDGGDQPSLINPAPGLRTSYQELGSGSSAMRMCLVNTDPEMAILAEAYVEFWPSPLFARVAGKPLPGFVDRKSFCTKEQPYDVVVLSTRTNGSKSVGVSRSKAESSCPAASGGS